MFDEFLEARNCDTPIQYYDKIHKKLAKVMKEDVSSVVHHVVIKRRQALWFEKEKVNQSCVVMQIDFAENYTASFQDEIQSVHWHQNQVLLLTCAIWHLSGLSSYVLVSDCLDHDKNNYKICVRTFTFDKI